MKPEQRWSTLAVAVAATAVAATVTAGALPGSTAAPLPPEGSQPLAAIAHRDDIRTPQRSAARATDGDPVVPPSRGQSQQAKPPEVTTGDAAPSPQGIDVQPQGDAVQSRRTPAPLREPMSLDIPDLGIESTVQRTSMDSDGAVVVPEDVLLTGWFDSSRRLAARQGSTVIVGHRDSASQGSGALYAIEELPIGSTITVSGRDGTRYDFRVDSVEFIDKANLPSEAARVFTRYGPHRLVLITCGGAFDSAAGSYLSNVVVTATPIPGTSDLP